MKETKDYLELDPIAAAEKIIGKPTTEWDMNADAATALAISFAANQSKAEHLKGIGDTYFGISWEKFMDIVKSFGFEIGFQQKFSGTGYSGSVEEEIIFFHKEKGLILHAESFDGKRINSGQVYGEVKLDDTLTAEQCHAINGCSTNGNRNGTMSFSIDIREGLVYHLESITKAFEVCKTWSSVPFLWFLNYMDTKDKDYDYKAINEQKIAASSSEVRKIIYG